VSYDDDHSDDMCPLERRGTLAARLKPKPYSLLLHFSKDDDGATLKVRAFRAKVPEEVAIKISTVKTQLRKLKGEAESLKEKEKTW
jgi:hypothetical protein